MKRVDVAVGTQASFSSAKWVEFELRTPYLRRKVERAVRMILQRKGARRLTFAFVERQRFATRLKESQGLGASG